MFDRDADPSAHDAPMFAAPARRSLARAEPAAATADAPMPPPPPADGRGFDQAMIDIITRPVPLGDARDGFVDKERELARLFATLTPAANLALHRRLAAGRAGDPVVAAFSRLVASRRDRLLQRLADARARRATR